MFKFSFKFNLLTGELNMLKKFHSEISGKPLIKIYLVAVIGGFSGYWIAEGLLMVIN
jgi:hypothetical protein